MTLASADDDENMFIGTTHEHLPVNPKFNIGRLPVTAGDGRFSTAYSRPGPWCFHMNDSKVGG